MLPVVPEDLWTELVQARWEERLTYTQIAERYPLYSRTALVRTIKRASPRRHYLPACGWCGQRFRTARADAHFCSNRCLWAAWWFHHRLDTQSRPPEILAQRECVVCSASLRAKRADARFCGKRCQDRHRRRRANVVNGCRLEEGKDG